MRRFILVFLSLLFLPLPAQAGGEEKRTFTAQDGGTVEGTILKADATSVTIIKSADQRQATFPILALSEPDQRHVRAWLAAPERQRVEISANRNKVSRDSKGKASVKPSKTWPSTKTTSVKSKETEVWQWEITVKNETNLPLLGARVEYTQLVGARGNSGNRKAARKSSGSLPLPVIPGFGSVTVKTTETTVTSTQSYQRVAVKGANGSKTYSTKVNKRVESLDGVRIRLLYQDQVLKETNLGSGK